MSKRDCNARFGLTSALGAAALMVSGCGSLPPPVGSIATAWVKGTVERDKLPGAIEVARVRHPSRTITAKDLVRVSCSMDDISWYEGNAIAPDHAGLARGTIVRVKVLTPIVGITDRHLDEIVAVVAPPGQISTELPRARNGKLIEYPAEVRRNYVGSAGATLALACSAGLQEARR